MMSFLTDYAGRLHPLVVHFPIALLLVSAAVELLRLFRERESLGIVSGFCLLWGAVGACVAAATGWLFALQVHRPPEMHAVLFWHRWLGVLTALVASTAWLVQRGSFRSAVTKRPWFRALFILAAALLLIVVAHLGAALVWGLDFFS